MMMRNLVRVPCSKSDQPLPPPPASGQWAHLYTSGSGQYLADSGVGTGNTYEVPHHHPATRTPAPSLQYGYSSYPHHPPSLASMYSGSVTAVWILQLSSSSSESG